MRVPSGVQCDVCNSITRDDKAFYSFVLPPALDPMTGLPSKRGNFPGVASESNPRQLALLMACPSCMKKLTRVIKFTTRTMVVGDVKRSAIQVAAIGDLQMLPPGRLRRILEQMKAKYGGSLAST